MLIGEGKFLVWYIKGCLILFSVVSSNNFLRGVDWNSIIAVAEYLRQELYSHNDREGSGVHRQLFTDGVGLTNACYSDFLKFTENLLK